MTTEYDIHGVHGAETFRDLELGLLVATADGWTGEIVANPHDGAFLQLKIVEWPDNPGRVGEEELVYYQEVKRVYSEE
jgi:hypothetical protein